MTPAAINTAAELEAEIARQITLAEQAVRDGNPDKAHGHYSMIAGLISRRTDVADRQRGAT